MFKQQPKRAFFVTTIAASLFATLGAASAGQTPTQAQFQPVQSISYAFGSLSINGYYTQHAATCVVMLTVVDANVAEDAMPLSPVRVRMTLLPGQTGGIDSENGDAINITCMDGAASMLVDVGTRDHLAEIQTANLPILLSGSH
jgi:hypothetical protein